MQHGLSVHDRLAIYVATDMANHRVYNIYEQTNASRWRRLRILLSYVRGYHEYKEGCTPSLGEMLELKVELTNPHDQFAMAAIKPDGKVVWHISKHMPVKLFHSFSRMLGVLDFVK